MMRVSTLYRLPISKNYIAPGMSTSMYMCIHAYRYTHKLPSDGMDQITKDQRSEVEDQTEVRDQ